MQLTVGGGWQWRNRRLSSHKRILASSACEAPLLPSLRFANLFDKLGIFICRFQQAQHFFRFFECMTFCVYAFGTRIIDDIASLSPFLFLFDCIIHRFVIIFTEIYCSSL